MPEFEKKEQDNANSQSMSHDLELYAPIFAWLITDHKTKIKQHTDMAEQYDEFDDIKPESNDSWLLCHMVLLLMQDP